MCYMLVLMLGAQIPWSFHTPACARAAHAGLSDLLYRRDTANSPCPALPVMRYSDTSYTAIQLYSVYTIHPDTLPLW